MQQVRSEAFLAGARLVDPRALPVPVRTPRQRLVNRFARAWVLHSRAIRRTGLVVALLAVGTMLYEAREPLGTFAATLGHLTQGELAGAGLAIGEISIDRKSVV